MFTKCSEETYCKINARKGEEKAKVKAVSQSTQLQRGGSQAEARREEEEKRRRQQRGKHRRAAAERANRQKDGRDGRRERMRKEVMEE